MTMTSSLPNQLYEQMLSTLVSLSLFKASILVKSKERFCLDHATTFLGMHINASEICLGSRRYAR